MSDAAILMVHDRGTQVTERLGLAVYGGLLLRGPYAELLTLQGPEDGNARLAAAIVELAGRHDAVDVFLSIHTTERDPAAWAEAIPSAARKLRLVYSTACWGLRAEAAAWVAVGAQAVVVHEGLNDPLVAMPCVLSRWLSGRPVGEAVAEAAAETDALHALGLALPGTAHLLAPRQVSDGYGVGDPVSGSRPRLLGDRTLRLSEAGAAATEDPAQAYDPETGGALGLAVRAAAGRLNVEREEVLAWLNPALVVAPWGALLGAAERLRVTRPGRGAELTLELSEPCELPFEGGVTLSLERRVSLRPGRFDVHAGSLELFLHGVAVRYGPVRYGLRQVVLEPKGSEGFQVRVRGTAFGLLPLRLALPIGGSPLRAFAS